MIDQIMAWYDASCQIFRSDMYKIFFKSPLWLWLNVRVLPHNQIALFASFFFASEHHDGGWTCYCRQIFGLDFCKIFLHVITMMVVDCVAKYSDWIFAIHHHGGSWICKCCQIFGLDFLQDFLQVTTIMVVECVGVAKCWDWIENFNGDIRLQPNGTR